MAQNEKVGKERRSGWMQRRPSSKDAYGLAGRIGTIAGGKRWEIDYANPINPTSLYDWKTLLWRFNRLGQGMCVLQSRNGAPLHCRSNLYIHPRNCLQLIKTIPQTAENTKNYSICSATDKILFSWKWFPIICKPTGKLPIFPAGNESPGNPAIFSATV